MLTFEFNSNTKMALRAVAVAIICIVVARTFTFERSYWVYLTAFLLITQSFGDGIYRSLMRFILTIIGCLLGWIIYMPFANSPTALTLISFTALFFMLYWFTGSLIGRTLATGILLVSSFGMLSGGWTFDLLMARIFDTLIGATIAIFVNGLILPEFSKSSLKAAFESLRTSLFALNEKLIQENNLESLQVTRLTIQDLEKERVKLSQIFQSARYELLFRKQRQQHYKNLMTQTNIVFAYLNAMLDIKVAETTKANPIKATLAESGESYYRGRLNTELNKLAAL